MGKVSRTPYLPEYAKIAEKVYARLHATDKDVAAILSVSVSTIVKWTKENPDFAEARARGKSVADDKVEASLFQRAIGYSHPEEKVFCNQGEVTKVETTKHYPPDATAMIFWLKNRRPQAWRERHDVNHDGNVQVSIEIGAKTQNNDVKIVGVEAKPINLDLETQSFLPVITKTEIVSEEE